MIQTTHTYCVYQHRRNDTGEIFYIGIGKRQNRAYAKDSRSKRWLSITSKHGYSVEILLENVSRTEAIYSEMYLISFYGRMDLGTGRLVNMTDGGEGTINISKESRRRMSIAASGRTGSKNSMYGKSRSSVQKSSKAVIDISTNAIYPSAKEAAKTTVYCRRYVAEMLLGRKPNKTNLRYFKNDPERITNKQHESFETL